MIGSVGTRNGSFAITSARSASPGTSTPSQNESVPRRIADPACRKRRSKRSRGCSPCTSSGQRPVTSARARSAAAVARSARWLVKRTKSPPSAAWATSHTMSTVAPACPSASPRGSGTSSGTAKRHWSRKLNGEGSTSRGPGRTGGRSMPSRPVRKSKLPPTASVALVTTMVSTRPNSTCFSSGASSSGIAATARCAPPRRSSQRTIGGAPAGGLRAVATASRAPSSRPAMPRSSASSWARRSDGGSSRATRSTIETMASRSRPKVKERLVSASPRPALHAAASTNASVSRTTFSGWPARCASSRRKICSAARRASASAGPSCSRTRASASSRTRSSASTASAARSAGTTPRFCRSSRERSRSTPRDVACLPRCSAAVSSRWCPSSSTRRR